MAEEKAKTQEEISEADWTDTPARVRELVIALKGRIEQLETQIAGLQEQVNRNSGNSSQPASQNGAKGFQAKPKEKSKKRRGGQEGHQGHERQMYETEDCASIEEHYPQRCWQCGEDLQGRDESPQRIQVVELPSLKPVVKEHRFHAIECSCCGARTRAFEAEIVNGSGYGERLAGLDRTDEWRISAKSPHGEAFVRGSI
jgi:transposase